MNFSFTTLGTASALPIANRYPSAHVLNIRERLFLIDCGEGTQLQMRKYDIPLTNKILNLIFLKSEEKLCSVSKNFNSNEEGKIYFSKPTEEIYPYLHKALYLFHFFLLLKLFHA